MHLLFAIEEVGLPALEFPVEIEHARKEAPCLTIFRVVTILMRTEKTTRLISAKSNQHILLGNTLDLHIRM